MFAGVMVLPAAMSGVVTLAGSYAQVYSVIGALALVAGLGLVWGIREAPRRS